MGNKIIQESTLVGIADAIRSKVGNTNLIELVNMADIIRNDLPSNYSLRISHYTWTQSGNSTSQSINSFSAGFPVAVCVSTSSSSINFSGTTKYCPCSYATVVAGAFNTGKLPKSISASQTTGYSSNVWTSGSGSSLKAYFGRSSSASSFSWDGTNISYKTGGGYFKSGTAYEAYILYLKEVV